MTDRRTEEQLDAMLAALQARPAQLDEVAQARVRARLEAALVEVDLEKVRAVGQWRRVGVAGGVGLAAAAAVIAVVVAARTGGPSTGTIATADHPAPASRAAPADPLTPAGRAATATDRTGSAGRPAPAGTAVPGPADPGHPAAIAAGTPPGPAAIPSTAVTVAAGDSIQLALAGASVTLYGPGQLSPTPDGAVVDAARLVVDRPRGDAPWSVLYRGTKVVVSHGAFTIEGGAQARFRVVRGEIELHCPSGLQTIRSGGSSACEPIPEIRATPRVSAPGAAPAVAQAEAAPPAPRPAASPPPPTTTSPPPAPAPTPAELYATAESALGRGDLDAAQAALLAVVDADPDSLDAAVALIDLARLAAKRGDTGRALDYLTRLDRHPRRAWVAAPAALLLQSLAREDSIRDLNRR